MNHKKTAIYCRTAIFDEIAVAKQEAQCWKCAHALGIGDAGIAVYRDCGTNGATLDRPAMNALTADIEAGSIGTVIAPDLARVARNFTLMSEWRELLRVYGVKLVTLAEGNAFERDKGLKYRLVGDYLLPLLALSDPPDAPPLGKYGRMHKAYLKTHRPILYNKLLLSEQLYPLCREIDRAAETRLAAIPDHEAAHEIVLAEIVYR
jgi:hypothetical protein